MKNTNQSFRPAYPSDLPSVYALYRSVLGTPFCVWNENYPGMEELREDFAMGNLYVLTCGDALLGAVSVVSRRELDDLPCWSCRDGTQAEIARVVVAPKAQGQGLARTMVEELLPILKARGLRWIHLSAAKGNLPACRTYEKAGFSTVGEAELFGGQYLLMEKAIL